MNFKVPPPTNRNLSSDLYLGLMYARVVSRDRSSNSTASANISMSRFEGDPRELVFFCRSPKRTSETQFVVRSIHFHPRLNGGVRGGTTSTSVSPQITTKLTRGGWIGERDDEACFSDLPSIVPGAEGYTTTRRIGQSDTFRACWDVIRDRSAVLFFFCLFSLSGG